MRALVVYESMFGNTKAVAEAIARGLSSSMTVDLLEVGCAPTSIGDEVDLLIVGGPTHAFGLSRRSTRRDAKETAGAGVVSQGIGLREWLDALSHPATPIAATAFDTRIDKPRMPGSAARRAMRSLRRAGFRPAAPVVSFRVRDLAGPLVDGEVKRAMRWGEELAVPYGSRLPQ